ncbi:MAG: hypothetical protein AB1646_01685 [Thermodesulfobacteriota bacterium]
MKTMLRLLVVVLTAIAFAASTSGIAAWAADDQAGVEEKGVKNTNKNTNKPPDNKNKNTNKPPDNKNKNTNKPPKNQE